jgi:hypothetical protein
MVVEFLSLRKSVAGSRVRLGPAQRKKRLSRTWIFIYASSGSALQRIPPMKLCLKILAIAVIAAFTYSLTGCASPPSFTYTNVGITLSETCSDCQGGSGVGVFLQFDPAKPWALLVDGGGNQQGGSILFTATVTNAPSNLTWTLYPTQDLIEPNPNPNCQTTSTPCSPTNTGNPQELTAGWLTGDFVVESGNTALFQNAVIGGVEPIYTGAALAQAEAMTYTVTYPQEVVLNTGVPQLQTVSQQMTGIPQGSVLMGVSVPSDPANPSTVTTAYQLMEIYASAPVVYMTPSTPGSPAVFTDSVLSIPHSTASQANSYAFYGGAAGAPPCAGATCNGAATGTTDNSVIWEVGASSSTALAGGSTTYGTITSTGVYTAPTAIPPTGTNLLPGQIVVVMASHESPSKTAVAYVTIY